MDKKQLEDKLKELEESKRDVCEKWRRVNDVASKFYLSHLHETGEEWEEFCKAMNQFVLSKE